MQAALIKLPGSLIPGSKKQWLITLAAIALVVIAAFMGAKLFSGSSGPTSITETTNTDAQPNLASSLNNDQLPVVADDTVLPMKQVADQPFPTTEEMAGMQTGWNTPFSWDWGEYSVDETWRLHLRSDNILGETAELLLVTFWEAGLSNDVGHPNPMSVDADRESLEVANLIGIRLVDRENLTEYGAPTPREIYSVLIEPGEFYGAETESRSLVYSAVFTINFEAEHGKETIRLLVKADSVTYNRPFRQLRLL